MHIDESLRERIETMIGSGQTMADAIGIEFLKLTKEVVIATMTVDHRTVQPMRILHGGASVALAETVTSVGAYLNLDRKDQATVGLEINANHIRSVPEGGKVTGRGIPVHLGRSTQVWEARITDAEGRLVSISRCTIAVINQ